MARRIQGLQRGAASKTVAGRGAMGPGAAAGARLRAVRRSFEASDAHGAELNPWGREHAAVGGLGGSSSRPRTAPAPGGRGCLHDEAGWGDPGDEAAERTWAWAGGSSAAAADAAAAAAAARSEAAGRAEWEDLKQRRRYPELRPPVQPVELPPSRWGVRPAAPRLRVCWGNAAVAQFVKCGLETPCSSQRWHWMHWYVPAWQANTPAWPAACR